MMEVIMKYIIWFTLIFRGSSAQNMQLNIANGPILGRKGFTVYNNKTMNIYQGIPYADPPVRFERAVAKGNWTEVLNCTYDKPQCIQGSNPVEGSEDCLTLDVYSPDLNGNYPVLAWVHGGYFTTYNGSYTYVAPDFFIDEEVVVVVIQYRLGIFGFMSTGDLTCPGNLGFKDQVLALEWVQKNIRFFGGDPDRVTLGGQSAGAVGVSLHLQSPLSKGLFRGMILNSGTSFNLWSYNRRAKETAFKVGNTMCLLALSSEALVKCLKQKKAADLQTVSVIVSTLVTLENPLAGIWYGYVSEPDHPEAFFTGKSEQQVSTGQIIQVPLLLGFTSNEGLFFGNISAIIRAYLLSYDLTFPRITPADLTDELDSQILASVDIKGYFFNYGLLAAGNDTRLYDYISSDQFVRPIWQFALDFSSYVSETYFYQFSYEGKLGSADYRAYSGVFHGEDLKYFFYKFGENPSEQDLQTRYRLVRLWCNFVKNLNPTPRQDPLLQNKTWLPIRNGNVEGTYNYFDINSDLQSLTNPKESEIQFWNKTYLRYTPTGYTRDTY